MTAYDEYAIPAFKLHALDFITKPIQEEELVKSIEYAILDCENKISQAPISSISDHTKIIINSRDNKLIVNVRDLVYISAAASYCNFHYLKDGQLATTVASKPLHFYENALDSNFIRIHKSFIVNSVHITQVLSNSLKLFDNNVELEVSRRKHSIVYQFFHNR